MRVAGVKGRTGEDEDGEHEEDRLVILKIAGVPLARRVHRERLKRAMLPGRKRAPRSGYLQAKEAQ